MLSILFSLIIFKNEGLRAIVVQTESFLLLMERNTMLKEVAEGEKWRELLEI